MENTMNDRLLEMKTEWKRVFKNPPPPRVNYDFMNGHVSWIKQAETYGSIKSSTHIKLRKLMKQLRDDGDIAPDNSLIIKLGTRLVRQYKGKRYDVIATKDGFLYQDKEYKSLSIIAREITGTRWNGRVFFGVKKS